MADNDLMTELQTMSKRLQRLIGTTLATDVKEPPRLVRANSAFDLAKAIDKLMQNPDFAEIAKRG